MTKKISDKVKVSAGNIKASGGGVSIPRAKWIRKSPEELLKLIEKIISFTESCNELFDKIIELDGTEVEVCDCFECGESGTETLNIRRGLIRKYREIDIYRGNYVYELKHYYEDMPDIKKEDK